MSHLIRVGHFELPAVTGPGDEVLAGLVGEELQDELPELDGAGGRDGGARVRRGHAHGGRGGAAGQLRGGGGVRGLK